MAKRSRPWRPQLTLAAVRGATVGAILGCLCGACSLLTHLDEPNVEGAADAGADGRVAEDAAVEGGEGLRLLKRMTFEKGVLVDADTAAESVVGAVTIETTTPPTGAFAARVKGTSTKDAGVPSYLRQSFARSTELLVSFQLRLVARPSDSTRVLRIVRAGATVAEVDVMATGALRAEGIVSGPLEIGRVYRVRCRLSAAERRFEVSLSPEPGALTPPFVSAQKTLDAYDRLDIGDTVGAGFGLDVVLDEVAVEGR